MLILLLSCLLLVFVAILYAPIWSAILLVYLTGNFLWFLLLILAPLSLIVDALITHLLTDLGS